METEILKYTSSREWLENIITEKIKNNPQYSLRAFARSVDLSPSFLSRVLSGKRPLSIKGATKICQALSLGPDESRELFNTIIKEQGNDKRPSEIKEEEEIFELSVDAFNVISDWYHYAIMQLIYTAGFKDDAKWIGKTLDISEMEAKLALNRLERLELLARDEEGKLYRTKKSLSSTHEIASMGLRKFQKQILEKSIESLQRDPLELRDITSITMAIDRKNIKKAKEEIKKFRLRMSRLLEKGDQTHVYNLGVHLIPLSDDQGEHQ